MAEQTPEEKAAADAAADMDAAAKAANEKIAAEEAAKSQCPTCDARFKVAEGVTSVRCPSCKTHWHVSDFGQERTAHLKAERRKVVEAAMAKAASEA